jgi:hypothetical protein
MGGRPTVLEVDTVPLTALAGADGAATVGDVGQLVDAAGFVLARQTHGVVLAAHGDVLLVAGFGLLEGRLDVLMRLGSPISKLDKLLCRPAPFQSPGIALGWKEILAPNPSAMRCRRKRAHQRWSPSSIPPRGPTWNSRWAGMMSALVLEILILAYRRAMKWATTLSLQKTLPAPTSQLYGPWRPGKHLNGPAA